MRIRVEGRHPLNGIYQPAGNSNAAISLFAASLLTEDAITLNNVPDTTTTRTMLKLAEKIGSVFTYVDKNTVTIRTAQLTKRALTTDDTEGFVSALLFLAPILVRRQYVRMEIDFPLSRIRTHLDALRDLGLELTVADGAIECKSSTWDYKDIILTQSSVTATSIVMMLAACLGKETVIHNAASEPHVQELAELLEMMGAQIQGLPSNVIRIFGKPDLHGTEITISPDHIEAASVAAISAMTEGRIQIDGINKTHFRVIDKIYRRLGINLDIDDHAIFVPRHESLTLSDREEDVDLAIETMPWPNFPSDLVATATVVATQARGTSLIHEKLFDNRLLFVDKLNAMGAQIVLCDPHRAIVIGSSPLHGIYMDSPDVRTGLGMLAAALVAHGETIIDNAQALNITFDGVVTKLKALGAKIEIE
ncbi:MAG: UDP-N-acetylglucosamine 1-carboxyvinyltransferase [Aggregatilineales bacterium]